MSPSPSTEPAAGGPVDGARTAAIFDPSVWEAAPPYELFARLRDEDPVAFVEHPAGHRGAWVVSRHADVVAVSRDPQRFSSRGGVVTMDDLDDEQLEARRTLLEEDPPRHTALRRLVAAEFVPRAVRGYGQMVRELTRLVLDAALEEDHLDVVTDLAQEVPIRVLCRLLGVPEEHTATLVGLGNRMVSDAVGDELAGHDPAELRLLPFGHPAALEAFELATALAEERRSDPGEDLTSRLLTGEVDGRPLTEQEFRTMWLMLVIAGNETTRHALSVGILALLERPELFDRWAADPSLDAAGTEELLRFTTPINWHRRTVTRPVELAGRRLAPGDKLVLLFASANRDGEVFAQPDDLVLDRDPNPHVTFGRGGPHFCLGAHLARLEVRIVLRELFTRVAEMDLAGPPERLRSDHFNGLVSLPVEVRPRTDHGVA
jgi:cytochrome P450